jgi:S-disulfanyl-L-cysteine oxidoreductase SoxD
MKPGGILLIFAACLVTSLAAQTKPQPAIKTAPASFGFGRAATPAEIAALDIDVRPDGTGLPPGRGSPAEGAPIYAARCASCHGKTGKEGPNDRLVGRAPGDVFPSGSDASATRTIGNYWPYATTIFDYTRRAMPVDAPGSLKDNEVYSLVAYLLFLNELIPADAVMDATSLPKVSMPARDRFVPDPRTTPKPVTTAPSRRL